MVDLKDEGDGELESNIKKILKNVKNRNNKNRKNIKSQKNV